MVFRISSRPDITEAIPTSLSRAGARAAKESTDKSFDIGINGLGFNLRANGQHPYMREADQVRKDQFDASDQAGEQSLGTWWRRSQNDWSLGEGVEWYEPGVREESAFRYWAGQGVNPWTQGKMTLLHEAEVERTVAGADPVYLSTFRHEGEDGYVVASGDSISYVGPTLSGEVRTNHLRNPGFTSRTVDGSAPTGISYSGGSANGRIVSFTADSNVLSYVLSTATRDAAGHHPVTDLPSGNLSCAVNVANDSGARVRFRVSIGFYDGDGNHLHSYDSAEQTLNSVATARLTVQNFTKVEGAVGYRVSVTVTRHVGNRFLSGESQTVGLAVIEQGGIVGEPFSGATPDAAGVDYAWVGTANASKSTATRAAVGSITLAGGGLTQPVIGGQRVYFGRTGVVGFTTPGGTETILATCTGQAQVWWVKSRLLVAVGQKVWWVDHTTSGQVLETNDNEIADGGDGWVWVDIADSPDSILLAGTDGTNSYVYAVTVQEDETTGLPVFTGASEVARMPYGERITCMGTYLGTYVALGTTLGMRVGVVGDQGRVQYGPILKQMPGVSDVSFYDSFAYFAATGGHPDGMSGLWRVDLSTQIGDTGRNPYASDLYGSSAGAATSVAFMGGSGRPVFAVGQDVHLESDTFVESGWFTNGKVRFRTTANKDFQHLQVSGILNGGQFDHRALVPGTSEEHRIVTQTPETGLPLANLDIQGGPLFEWMQIKTYITRDALNMVSTPEIQAWSLAAIPQPERSRLVRYPLQVWDDESGRFGAKAGYRGFAFDRVTELESVEDAGVPVLVEDERTGESYVASVETVQFTGVDNSDKAKTNWGGWVDVTVRVRR